MLITVSDLQFTKPRPFTHLENQMKKSILMFSLKLKRNLLRKTANMKKILTFEEGWQIKTQPRSIYD